MRAARGTFERDQKPTDVGSLQSCSLKRYSCIGARQILAGISASLVTLYEARPRNVRTKLQRRKEEERTTTRILMPRDTCRDIGGGK